MSTSLPSLLFLGPGPAWYFVFKAGKYPCSNAIITKELQHKRAYTLCSSEEWQDTEKNYSTIIVLIWYFWNPVCIRHKIGDKKYYNRFNSISLLKAYNFGCFWLYSVNMFKHNSHSCSSNSPLPKTNHMQSPPKSNGHVHVYISLLCQTESSVL